MKTIINHSIEIAGYINLFMSLALLVMYLSNISFLGLEMKEDLYAVLCIVLLFSSWLLFDQSIRRRIKRTFENKELTNT